MTRDISLTYAHVYGCFHHLRGLFGGAVSVKVHLPSVCRSKRGVLFLLIPGAVDGRPYRVFCYRPASAGLCSFSHRNLMLEAAHRSLCGGAQRAPLSHISAGETLRPSQSRGQAIQCPISFCMITVVPFAHRWRVSRLSRKV